MKYPHNVPNYLRIWFFTHLRPLILLKSEFVPILNHLDTNFNEDGSRCNIMHSRNSFRHKCIFYSPIITTIFNCKLAILLPEYSEEEDSRNWLVFKIVTLKRPVDVPMKLWALHHIKIYRFRFRVRDGLKHLVYFFANERVTRRICILEYIDCELSHGAWCNCI